MKFLHITIAVPGMEKPLALGVELDESQRIGESMSDMAVAKEQIDDATDHNGGMLFECTDGAMRYFGQGLLSNALVEFRVLSEAQVRAMLAEGLPKGGHGGRAHGTSVRGGGGGGGSGLTRGGFGGPSGGVDEPA